MYMIFIIVVIITVAISIIDIKTFKIPDILLISLYSVLLVYTMFTDSFITIIASIISSIMLFLVFFLIFKYRGGIGFGDVKYAGVIGYALGFQNALYACLIASLTGIIFIFIFRILIPRIRKTSSVMKRKLAFGPFLSFGLVLVYYNKLI